MHALANPPTAAPIGDPGIVRRFLAWMQRAPAEGRAEAVSALARAYLHSDLPEGVRAEAVIALTSALDDPCALVRRALAEALASAADAPRSLVLGLASDQSDVARIVLARSPALTDRELVDCAAIGDAAAQSAIARRPRLAPGVAAAIAEIGEFAAANALAANLDVELPANVLRRLFDRFGADGRMREALSARPDLPAALRSDLAAATARALREFVAGRGWLDPRRAERIARDAREQTVVRIARGCEIEDLADLVARLREAGELTVALLMRALLSGDVGFFHRSLVEMSGLPERRVAGFLNQWRGQGFAALYAKAGLPANFLPAFRAALDVVAQAESPPGDQISQALTARLIAACERLADPRLAPIVSMLWRFSGESAREEAREYADLAAAAELAPRVAPLESETLIENEPPLVALAPEALIEVEPPPIVIEFDEANENFAPPIELDGEPLQDLADAA